MKIPEGSYALFVGNVLARQRKVQARVFHWDRAGKRITLHLLDDWWTVWAIFMKPNHIANKSTREVVTPPSTATLMGEDFALMLFGAKTELAWNSCTAYVTYERAAQMKVPEQQKKLRRHVCEHDEEEELGA